MMNAKQLSSTLDEMMKETKRGHLNWSLQIESTDDLDASVKDTVSEDGRQWLVDECFVSYSCSFRGEDFCMISYEHVLTCQDQTRMNCLIFLPPPGMRFFDLSKLLPYAIDADACIAGKAHMLFEQLWALHQTDEGRCRLQVIDPVKN
jgi:hypothetical protein